MTLLFKTIQAIFHFVALEFGSSPFTSATPFKVIKLASYAIQLDLVRSTRLLPPALPIGFIESHCDQNDQRTKRYPAPEFAFHVLVIGRTA